MAINALVVDDSRAMRTFIRRVLALSGVALGECWEASDGEEALALLAEQWVDIILTDINMPGMDGEQFVNRLERDELLRTIPVIVVSTDQTENRVQRMLTLGAKGYIKKPFLPETLRKELENVLGVQHGEG